jgi:DNA-binding transcriptional regulator YiaG
MKVAVKEKIAGEEENFRLAILSLRESLGLTQEIMARNIGCSFAAYRKWESGAANPSGLWLIKILALCPDEESLRKFGVERKPDARIRPQLKLPGKRK